MAGFHIDQLACAPMTTAFVSLAAWNISVPGPGADGMLGYEFLHQYKVMIHFKRKELYLW